MHLAFTGTREGMTAMQFSTLIWHLRRLRPAEVHHGDCLGADTEFHVICVHAPELGWPVFLNGRNWCPTIHIHPPNKDSRRGVCGAYTRADLQIVVHPPKPYLDRDRDMVNQCDTLIAAPRTPEQQVRSGTWSTIHYARKAKVPILIIRPNGSVKEE